MAVIIAADLHIHPHQRLDTMDPETGLSHRLRDCIDSLRWLGSLANKYESKSLIIAGDFFHKRDAVPVVALQEATLALEFLLSMTTLEDIYILAGNHDQASYDVTSIRSLRRGCKSTRRVHTITNPRAESINGHRFDFIPYRETPEEFRELSSSFEAYEAKGHNRYCITHVAAKGAHVGTFEHVPKHGIEGTDVKCRYDQIFAGHYHAHQTLGKRFVYVGAPLQFDRGDMGCPKGAVVLDETSSRWHFVENPRPTPRFVDVPYGELRKDARSKHLKIPSLSQSLWGNFVFFRLDKPEASEKDIARCEYVAKKYNARNHRVVTQEFVYHLEESGEVLKTVRTSPVEAAAEYGISRGLREDQVDYGVSHVREKL